MNTKNQKLEKIASIGGIIIGIAAVVIGVIILFIDTERYGSNPSDASFGADFYTYIYDATKIAANNVAAVLAVLRGLALIVKLFCSCILIGGGILTVLKNVIKIKNADLATTEPIVSSQTATAYGAAIPAEAKPTLDQYQELLDLGILTPQQFEEKRAALIGTPASHATTPEFPSAPSPSYPPEG